MPGNSTRAARLLRPAATAAACGVLFLWIVTAGGNEVVAQAYRFPNGGGYASLADSGVSHTIRHHGSVVLPASQDQSSYCCGFTFQVAFEVANARGLLKRLSIADVRNLQRTWYGSLKGTAARQCVQAMEQYRIGREVSFEEARPGDFAVYTRRDGVGHSVVFLSWVREPSGGIVGMMYRSSQGNTRGIANQTEFFADGGRPSGIVRNTLFMGRLHRPWWSALASPFST